MIYTRYFVIFFLIINYFLFSVEPFRYYFILSIVILFYFSDDIFRRPINFQSAIKKIIYVLLFISFCLEIFIENLILTPYVRILAFISPVIIIINIYKKGLEKISIEEYDRKKMGIFFIKKNEEKPKSSELIYVLFNLLSIIIFSVTLHFLVKNINIMLVMYVILYGYVQYYIYKANHIWLKY